MTSAVKFRLVVKEGASEGQVFELASDEAIIGRDPAADVVLESSVVSRQHALIIWKRDQFYIEDLGSSNGTFLDGQRVEESVPLQSGTEIGLGPKITLLFQVSQELDSPSVGSFAKLPGAAQTMLDSEIPQQFGEELSPQLVVMVAGDATQTFTLKEDHISIGRAEDNDIVIGSTIVSRHHARLERIEGGYQFVPVPDATNPIYLDGRVLSGPQRLSHNQILRIGGHDPGMIVTFVYQAPGEQAAVAAPGVVHLGEKAVITIGRDPENDVVLATPNVSRFHTQIERVGQRYRLRDLRSSNGTFVNNRQVEGEAWLKPDDTIRIASHRFVLGADRMARYDESGGYKVEAVGLNKWVRKDLNILKNISLVFQPREFIVLVGQSGGGKSTLMDALAGYRPATNGIVKVNDIDVYQNFDAIRSNIGYVPQKDIIHFELTVFEALDYSARLRMPPDTSKKERHQRVWEVLEELDLAHRKDVKISGLSGGQQKRVSIGVELLTKPDLFFLDEPTSGLDPGTETAFMQLLRRLADQGRTIVLVTHATKNVMLADRVIFLARGGHLAWFGPPNEALEYFDQYRSAQDHRISRMEFDQIYAILDDSRNGTGEDWAERFKSHPAYRQYILSKLRQEQVAMATGVLQSPLRELAPVQVRRSVSGLYQFMVLSTRNLRIIFRDRSSLILMLLAAPLVGSLDFLLAAAMGKDLYDYTNGDVSNLSTTIFMLTIYSLMVGGLSQMREFVKERDVYRRERLINLKIFPYISSKVWLALLLAIYQAAAYTLIRHLAFDMPGGTLEFVSILITVFFSTFAGMMGGLLISSLAPNANSAPLLVILFIIPQIVLSGALAPVPSLASAPAATRWSFEALMGITGVGSDVAADACWALPEELRDSMTIDDKEFNGCRCMGRSVFDPDRCHFPGVGQFYDPALDQPEPEEPLPLGDPPPTPAFPPPPTEPREGADVLDLTEYLEALRIYQEETDRIRADYELRIEAHQSQAEVFQAEFKASQEELIDWQMQRNAAVGAAEGLIDGLTQEFGWTFVNKNDAGQYWSRIFTAWFAQVVISSALFLLILFFIKRKDKN